MAERALVERPAAPTARPTRAAAARLDPTLARLRSAPRRPAGGVRVGAAHDPAERAADRTADRVVRVLARRSDPGPGPVAPPSAANAVHRHAAPTADPGGSGRTAEVGAAGGALSAGLGGRVTAARGHGRPLPDGVRASMESAFGADLARVRVHPESDLAPRVAATAFTHGRDIHFAPGAYHPDHPSGQWLLAHELAHVVAGDGRVRRHASREHYLLGALSVDEIRRLAGAKTAVADLKGTIAKTKDRKRALPLLADPTSISYSADYVDAVQTIQEQLRALERWRTATPTNPSAAQVNAGATAYDRAQGRGLNAQFDHKWGGQLLTVQCADHPLVCTVGDLNALPDFFGSLDDVAGVDAIVVFRTLQVIRRETYIYLNTLLAELTLSTWTYNKKKRPFASIEDNNVSLPGAGSDLANAAVDVMQTETMLKGKANEQGLPESIGASATLGRNACHFPPESWLRWLDHHRRARALIAGATDLNDLRGKANQAIGLNAFGEHYLQDSFAAGHLINKGFVMAYAMEFLSDTTKTAHGIGDAHIAAFQTATAHSAAYDLPRDASARAAEEAAGQAVTPQVSLDDPTVATARDPQTALERARGAVDQRAHLRLFGQQEEIRGMGLDPNAVKFPMYRYWLNDFWLQKITNTLHDRFCVEGLTVASPAHPGGLFQIFGDAHMLRSEAGTRETALTSRLSHDAINALVKNKRAALTPGLVGPAVPVPSEAAIMSHFPNEVRWKGVREPLADWATGPSMKRLIRKLVAGSSAVTQGKVTGAVRLASAAKTVSGGLGVAHSPF